MKINKIDYVVAHDYFTQRGGAERVALELIKGMRPKYVATSVWNPDQTFPDFKQFTVRESFLRFFRAFKKEPRWALPFLPFAWSRLPAVSADVVICSSSGWSHSIRTSNRTKKIVYCHNPARWLYQDEDYLLNKSWVVKKAWGLLKTPLIAWDKSAAQSADCYIANSTSVAARIKKIYGFTPKIVFPPVCIDVHAPKDPIANLSPGFFITVSRSRGYKGTQIVIDAFRGMNDTSLVIVGGGDFKNLPDNVISVGKVSDAQLRWLYAEAKALISLSKEDFGLTPIEANAFGTPVLVLREGGFLDTTHEGVSGCFVDKADPKVLAEEIEKFPVNWDKNAIIKNAERFSVSSFMSQITTIAEEVI